MPPIDVKALMKSLDRTGRVFRVGFTGGGEPFLIPNIIEACVALAEKHYLSFNTNLTSLRVRQVAERVDPARVSFHASLHIKELERTDLLRRFIETYLICKERGFTIYAQEVAHPSLMSEIGSYRQLFRAQGVEITFAPFKGEYLGRDYPDAYTDKEIEYFDLQRDSARTLFRQRGNLCNAGYNAVAAGPDGLVNPCFDIPEHLGHIFGKFHFQYEIRTCPVDLCTCPFNEYDKPLFRLALSECGMEVSTSS